MTPQLFLPFIEAHNESAQLLDVVVRRALEAAAAFREAGYDWRVSVNLSGSELQAGVAPEIVLNALRDADADPASLVLEAPEAALLATDSIVRAALERLRLFGCGVALDSGGALPLEAAEAAPELFTEIKIGGPSIMRFAEIARKVDGGRIARRLAFAQRHGLRSVAVGVEQEKTLAALVKLGFTAIQGAFIAKPVALEALVKWDGVWGGESAIIPAAPLAVRPKPRLVTPATAPLETATPSPVAKLVEKLAPTVSGFDAYDEGDDAFDVGFDDDVFVDETPPTHSEAMQDEADPSADTEPDGEELGALDASAPLHAGLIDRPRKRMATTIAMPPEEPAEDQPAEPAVVFDRPLALRVRPAPVKPTLMQRLGLGRFSRP